MLALDTATENCSAALWIDGTLTQRERELARGHADLILTMIDELLGEADLRLAGLDAIAFGRGPGSFTGVRLAASVTQGLAFAAGLPVVPVSDLQAVAQRAFRTAAANNASPHILVCNDARMQEVYWGCFDRGQDGLAVAVGPERVSKPADVFLPDEWKGAGIQAAGRGFAAYDELGSNFRDALTAVDNRILPGAAEIASLAIAALRVGKTVSPAEAVPVYLRDDVARPKAS